MGKLDEYVTIKDAATYLGVALNTLRNWGLAGKIKTYRHPMNNYRLFKQSDLEGLLQEIEESGKHPAGRKRPSRNRTKPR
jgi:MerR family transcriptional regulator, copper efflux regulator